MARKLEPLFNPNIVGKAARRSRTLRYFGDTFLASEPGTWHYSPSGMTAVLYAERALAEGRSVTMQIHPTYGVALKRGTDAWLGLDEIMMENEK